MHYWNIHEITPRRFMMICKKHDQPKTKSGRGDLTKMGRVVHQIRCSIKYSLMLDFWQLLSNEQAKFE